MWKVERLDANGNHFDWLADGSGRTVVIDENGAAEFNTYEIAEAALRRLEYHDETGCELRIVEPAFKGQRKDT